MIVAVADTHSAIWYLSADPRLSVNAKLFMSGVAQAGDEIAISSITLVEMVYLVEKGRIPSQRFTELAHELTDPTSMFYEVPVELGIARAVSKVSSQQIPDMPDRIIAATAVKLVVPVISRDGKIQLSSVQTIW